MTASTPGQRFHTLDALRGVAAVAVMLFHGGADAPLVTARGYLAADLFFALSGFVLAHAYEKKLRDGLSPLNFLRARLARIYPLFLLGAVTGYLLWPGSLLVLLMIPTPSPGGMLFSNNVPLWSLLFELIANLAWALLAVRLRLRWLALLAASFAALFFPAAQAAGHADLGAFWATALPGLARTCFSFTMGLILFRLFERYGKVQVPTARGWLLLPLLLAILTPATSNPALADIATLCLALPLIVWLGARWQVRGGWMADRIGGISFPLYCIHAPILALGRGSPDLVALISAGLIAAALLLDRFYDRPVQGWLRATRQTACRDRAALA
ncbi:MAG: acyltransferase [Novosphingobium sp.]|nr:acyltransferase [Novosphingobium sp.]